MLEQGGLVKIDVLYTSTLIPGHARGAIVGASLAGLFVVETLLLEPDLFDTCIAIDPSPWWNQGALARQISAAPPTFKDKALYIATSADVDMVVDGAAAAGRRSRVPAQAMTSMLRPMAPSAALAGAPPSAAGDCAACLSCAFCAAAACTCSICI